MKRAGKAFFEGEEDQLVWGVGGGRGQRGGDR